MKRQVIRLTEGDLHRIIENSVKKVINELDWKTYANAAEKDLARGHGTERAFKFNKAAEDTFNDKYNPNGYNKNKINDIEFKNYPHLNDIGGTLRVRTYATTDDNGRYDSDSNTTIYKDGSNRNVRVNDIKYNGRFDDNHYSGKKSINPLSLNKKIARASSKAYDDMMDYYSGTSNYTKGKGWNEPKNKTDWHDGMIYGGKNY